MKGYANVGPLSYSLAGRFTLWQEGEMKINELFSFSTSELRRVFHPESWTSQVRGSKAFISLFAFAQTRVTSGIIFEARIQPLE